MKRWFRILMVFLLTLTLAGCAAGQAGNSGTSAQAGSAENQNRKDEILEGDSGGEGQESDSGSPEGQDKEAAEPGEQDTEEIRGSAPTEEGNAGSEESLSSEEAAGAKGATETGDSAESGESDESADGEGLTGSETELPEDGTYTTKEDVALYLYLYGHLPSNFITKKEAEKLGWTGGSLEPFAPDKCIGGSRFGNYEGLLPQKEGRSYTECDIDTLGADKRGAKRIVFSNDGLIYYTEDHYESFELLYGEE